MQCSVEGEAAEVQAVLAQQVVLHQVVAVHLDLLLLFLNHTMVHIEHFIRSFLFRSSDPEFIMSLFQPPYTEHLDSN